MRTTHNNYFCEDDGSSTTTMSLIWLLIANCSSFEQQFAINKLLDCNEKRLAEAH